MPRFSESDVAQHWLGQFDEDERPVASRLLDELLLVRADELWRGIKELLDKVLEERKDERPLALYAERAVDIADGSILPLFGAPDEPRATGHGPVPVPFDPASPEVGSEGTIANLITSYQRLYGDDVVLDHPGPDKLREKRAGPIVIVADFIGSGSRAWEMLEAFRAVRTIRSWKSYDFIDFYVIAYAGTAEGLSRVRSNRLRPNVWTVAGCPTVDQAFRGEEREAIRRLCLAHPSGYFFPFGFGGSSALIAFEHGIPDNAPAILHNDHNGWHPLFPNRSALAATAGFPPSNADEVATRAKDMLNIRGAERYLRDARGRRWIQTMLALAAMESGASDPASVSARTRLSINTVEDLLAFTRIAHWTTDAGTLTTLGRAELRRLRRRRARTPILPTERKPYYYPTQLRAR